MAGRRIFNIEKSNPPAFSHPLFQRGIYIHTPTLCYRSELVYKRLSLTEILNYANLLTENGVGFRKEAVVP